MRSSRTRRRSAPGAAAASCTSASRSTTSACAALLRPGDGIDTVITADAYGAGEADALLGRALRRRRRATTTAWSARSATTSTTGEREGAKGFPRFTDPRAARPGRLRRLPARWPPSAASSAAASTRFDLLLLHNPDRTGYTSEAVWDGAGARCATTGLTRRARRRARPGQRLHARRDRLPRALRRPDRLGDGDPQPARAVAGRAGAAGRRARTTCKRDHARRRLRRPVPRRRARRATRSPSATTARSGPPAGSRRAASGSSALRPIAERHGLTLLQLACQWNLAHDAGRLRRRRR